MYNVNHLSIRINLEDIIFDLDYEKKVIENIRRCNRIVGKQFQVIFWHNNIDEKICEKFVQRHEKVLFEFNTKVTSSSSINCWFLIDSDNIDKCKYRYKFNGDVLSGIVTYLKMVKVRNNHLIEGEK